MTDTLPARPDAGEKHRGTLGWDRSKGNGIANEVSQVRTIFVVAVLPCRYRGAGAGHFRLHVGYGHRHERSGSTGGQDRRRSPTYGPGAEYGHIGHKSVRLSKSSARTV